MDSVAFDRFVNEHLRRNAEAVRPSIVPLFRREENKDVVLGSSVYFRAGDRYFLITATHVVENETRIVLQVDSDSGSPYSGFVGLRDPLDVAVAELKHPLSKYTPLELAHLLDLSRISPGGRFYMMGYPASKTSTFRNRMNVGLACCFLGKPKPVDHTRLNVSPEWSFGLDYPLQRLIDASGNNVNGVKPHGMSGGGVFWTPNEAHFAPADSFLVGILVRYDDVERETIVAMRLAPIAEILQKEFSL